ncbi:MAG TPA: hypothetical protein VEH52_08605 [Gaiellaceae bacterium]|nr:hypothetical protein [Gaiellaceae bacterium]
MRTSRGSPGHDGTSRAAFASVLLLLLAGCGGARQTARRATRDRPDDFAGPQIHFVYAVPAGRSELDRHLDTNGTLATSVALLVSWFRRQAGGPILAVDTYEHHPDITYVRLPRSDQAYEHDGPDTLAADVHRLLPLPRKKLTAIYYDGTLPASQSEVCGVGRGGRGRFAMVFVAQSCFDPDDLVSAQAGTYNALVFVMAHEIVHELDFVPAALDGNGSRRRQLTRPDVPVAREQSARARCQPRRLLPRAHWRLPRPQPKPYLKGPDSILELTP